MAKRKNLSGKSEPLLRAQVGRKLCHRYNDGTQLCVEGKRYGFTGTWIGKSGKSTLPVSTHDPKTAEPARSAEAALRNAKAFIQSVRTRSN